MYAVPHWLMPGQGNHSRAKNTVCGSHNGSQARISSYQCGNAGESTGRLGRMSRRPLPVAYKLDAAVCGRGITCSDTPSLVTSKPSSTFLLHHSFCERKRRTVFLLFIPSLFERPCCLFRTTRGLHKQCLHIQHSVN